MNNETTKNLIPQSERTKDEQREIARMGGIASGKARREKQKTQQAQNEKLLSFMLEQIKKQAEILEVIKEQLTIIKEDLENVKEN